MYFCVGYFRAESEKTLLTSVRSLRDNFSTISVEKLDKLRSAPNVSQAVGVVANATGSIFLLTDNYGSVLYTSDTTGVVNDSQTVSTKILNRAFSDGEYAELGELSGIYAHSYYSAGCPLINSDHQVIGYVFASRDAESLTAFLESMPFASCAAAAGGAG